jgi:uncharacterized protein YjaZ
VQKARKMELILDLLKKYRSRSILLIVNCTIILVVILSCKERVEYDFKRTKIVVNDQQFEILTAWQLFDYYIDAKIDYRKSIFNKIKNEFHHNTEYPFLYEAIKEPIKPDKKLSEVLELMKSIDFVRIVDSTYQLVTRELPGPDTKILFIPANPAYREIYKEYGIGFHAFTLGSGKIIVSFDPTFDNWRQFLPYALAHEYHHSVWTSRNFETTDFTPLEYLVFEGRADSFAKELFPDISHPFINNLDERNKERIWNLIKPEMNKRNTDMTDNIFYGTGDIPLGRVYTIGFDIVESFKKNNPLITDQALIDIAPEDILQGSKYNY